MVALRGHLWTLLPYAQEWLGGTPPTSRHWRTSLVDPDVGEVRLHGRLHRPTTPTDELLVVVHGLGGSHDSPYMMRSARAAIDAGIACLRLDLRGADRNGRDYYHAALIADLDAALADGQLAGFRHIYLMGWSLGGHLTYRWAGEHGAGGDARVVACATMCSPVDLKVGATKIDRPKGAFYRHRVLNGLKEIYAGVAQNRPVPISVPAAMRVETIRDWDDRVVAPRFAFRDAEDYWERAHAKPWLGAIRRPTLAVVTQHDPMVIAEDVVPHLRAHPKHLTTVVPTRGGHVGFPGGVDLGFGHEGSVESQVVAWLRAHC